MKFLFIHGANPHPTEDKLFQAWKEWLEKGASRSLPSGKISVLRYSDLHFKGSGQLTRYKESDFENWPINPAVRKSRGLRNNTKSKAKNKKSFFDLIEEFSKQVKFGAEDALSKQVFPQFDDYLNNANPPNSESNDGMRDIVSRRFRERYNDLAVEADEKLIVIGHSLGAIIGLDQIRSMGQAHHGIHLITIGSPQGQQFIQDQMKHLPFGRKVPNIVTSWQNVADLDDAIVGEKLVRQYYTRLEGSPKVFAVDYCVINKSRRGNAPFKNHDAQAYLRQPIMARILDEIEAS